MAELFIEKVKDGADFVYAAHAAVYDDDRSISTSCLVETPTVSEIIRCGNNSFWGKLWSKPLLEKRADFPNMLHEDVAEVPALISWAEHPAVIPKPLYYYYKSNSNSLTSTGVNRNRVDLFEADLMCWKK